jgi:hypothetical protein
MSIYCDKKSYRYEFTIDNNAFDEAITTNLFIAFGFKWYLEITKNSDGLYDVSLNLEKGKKTKESTTIRFKTRFSRYDDFINVSEHTFEPNFNSDWSTVVGSNITVTGQSTFSMQLDIKIADTHKTITYYQMNQEYTTLFDKTDEFFERCTNLQNSYKHLDTMSYDHLIDYCDMLTLVKIDREYLLPKLINTCREMTKIIANHENELAYIEKIIRGPTLDTTFLVTLHNKLNKRRRYLMHILETNQTVKQTIESFTTNIESVDTSCYDFPQPIIQRLKSEYIEELDNLYKKYSICKERLDRYQNDLASCITANYYAQLRLVIIECTEMLTSCNTSIKNLETDYERLNIKLTTEEKTIMQAKYDTVFQNASANIKFDHFTCPITKEKFQDPVIAKDGFTYERSAITEWLRCHNTSPMLGTQLKNKKLIPNYSLLSIVANWIE